jgi:hypothetical protein
MRQSGEEAGTLNLENAAGSGQPRATTADGILRVAPEVVLGISACLLTLLFGLRVFWCCKYAHTLDHASGTWSALAYDFSHGTFYRPLYAEQLGYGGTRYFPLHFVLQGSLMRLGVGAIAAGHLIEISSVLLLLAGIYAFLRHHRVQRFYAATLSLMLPAAQSGAAAALNLRCDALPLALNVWGFVVYLNWRSGWARVIVSSLLFTLAFASKETSIYCCVAACVALFLSGQRRDAIRTACVSAAGFASVIAVMYFATGGRVLGMMRAVSMEGAGIRSFAVGPVEFFNLIGKDAGTALFFALACMALFTLASRDWLQLPAIFFVLACGAVVLILSTPGAYWNHLIDVHVASICLFGTWLFGRKDQPVFRYGVAALAMAAFISIFPLANDLYHDMQLPRVNKYATAVRIAGSTPGPILAEDPLVAIVAGQRPYVLDAMTVAVVSRKDPAFVEPLEEKLQQQAFSVVVLEAGPASALGTHWYRDFAFGSWFIPVLEQHYELRVQSGDFLYYFPRQP